MQVRTRELCAFNLTCVQGGGGHVTVGEPAVPLERLTRGNISLGGSICMDLLTSDGVFHALRFL